MAEKTFRIEQIRGLNDYGTPSIDSSTSRSLDNVITRNNRLLGRLGLNKLLGISTASGTTPIIGLAPYTTPDGTSTLIRITPTKVEKLNTGTIAWDDITGTNLAASASSLPQSCMHKGTFCFTDGGADQIRKWAGSGNTATLGGGPPYCKALWQAWGFLFAGNVSSDGVTFSPRQILYTDDFDNDWSICNGNEINFEETSGGILVGVPYGQLVPVFKTDCVMQLAFIGGLVRFAQDKLNYSSGLGASLSPA